MKKLTVNGKQIFIGVVENIAYECKSIIIVYKNIKEQKIEVVENVEEFYIEDKEMRFYDTDGNQYLLKKV